MPRLLTTVTSMQVVQILSDISRVNVSMDTQEMVKYAKVCDGQ